MKLVGLVLIASLVVVMQAGVCDTPVLGVRVPTQQASYERGNDFCGDLGQQVGKLNNYVHFLRDIYGCATTNLSSWFAEQARKIDGNLVKVLRASANDRLDYTVTADLREAISFLEKTIKSERVAYNLEERHQIKLIITKQKKFIPNAHRALSFLSVANWLWKQATKIFLREPELKQSLKQAIQDFPAVALAGMVSSPTIKNMCLSLSKTGTFDELFLAWDAVSSYIQGDQQKFLTLFKEDFADKPDASMVNDKIISDFAGIIAVLMSYSIQFLTQESSEQKSLNIDQLLDLYNKVSTLPIVDAIVTLSTLAQQFSSIIDVLRQQDGNLDFGQWLKENWVVFPIVVGVIVVRVVQYFYQQNAGSTLVTI